MVPDHLLVLSRVRGKPETTCLLSKFRVMSKVILSISSKVPRKRSAREEPLRLTSRSTVSGVLFSRVSCVCSLDLQESRISPLNRPARVMRIAVFVGPRLMIVLGQKITILYF